MKKTMSIIIRPLNRGDIEICIKLFHDTVHSVNAKDYTCEQLNVWEPKTINIEDKLETERWQDLLDNIALVAELNGEIVGFIDMTLSGYLDRLYVHKDHQREGIASALLRELEDSAKQQSLLEITTEASITAKPFFEAMGYHVIKEQHKDVNGTVFVNFVMRKVFLWNTY